MQLGAMPRHWQFFDQRVGSPGEQVSILFVDSQPPDDKVVATIQA